MFTDRCSETASIQWTCSLAWTGLFQMLLDGLGRLVEHRRRGLLDLVLKTLLCEGVAEHRFVAAEVVAEPQAQQQAQQYAGEQEFQRAHGFVSLPADFATT